MPRLEANKEKLKTYLGVWTEEDRNFGGEYEMRLTTLLPEPLPRALLAGSARAATDIKIGV